MTVYSQKRAKKAEAAEVANSIPWGQDGVVSTANPIDVSVHEPKPASATPAAGASRPGPTPSMDRTRSVSGRPDSGSITEFEVNPFLAGK